MSADHFQRNFTLGQEGKNLVFRLRTPFTGLNGTSPAFEISNVFDDSMSHQLVISYSPGMLEVFVDAVKQPLRLDFTGSLERHSWFFDKRYGSVSIQSVQLLFYGIVFLPLGMLLGCMVLRPPHRIPRAILPGALFLIASAWGMDMALAVSAARALYSSSILSGVALGMCGIALLIWIVKAWQGGPGSSPA